MFHVLVQENNLIRLARRLVFGNLTIMPNLVGGLDALSLVGPAAVQLLDFLFAPAFLC